MENQQPGNASSRSILFQALRSAGTEELLAYNAVEETRKMAGDNHSAKIEVLKAEMNGKFDGVNKLLTGLYVFITVAIAVIGILVKS